MSMNPNNTYLEFLSQLEKENRDYVVLRDNLSAEVIKDLDILIGEF